MSRNAIADSIRKADKEYARWSFYHRVDARIAALVVDHSTSNTVYPLGWLVSTGRVGAEFCERILNAKPIDLARTATRIHAEHSGQCVRFLADAWKHAIAPEHFAAPTSE